MLNPAGTGVAGVMDQGFGSVRPMGESREAKVPLESYVGSKRCVCQTVYNGAERSKLIFPTTLLSWHAWTMMRSSRAADAGHPSISNGIATALSLSSTLPFGLTDLSPGSMTPVTPVPAGLSIMIKQAFHTACTVKHGLTVACGYVGMASMEALGRHQSGT